jgi:hypothetical protein
MWIEDESTILLNHTPSGSFMKLDQELLSRVKETTEAQKSIPLICSNPKTIRIADIRRRSAPSKAAYWLASVILRGDWLYSILKGRRLAATRGWIFIVSNPTRRIESWPKSLTGLCQRVFLREYAQHLDCFDLADSGMRKNGCQS